MNIELIGANVEMLRKERNLTQAQLGHYIGLTASAISNIECGRSVPSVDTLCRFADFFKVSLDSILTESVRNDFDKIVLEERLRVVDRYLSSINEVSATCNIENRNYRFDCKDGNIDYHASSYDTEE